jgi:VWFA-related protein
MVAGATWIGAQGTIQRPSFRSDVDVVTVDVSVRNATVPVADLGSGDFELLDNGTRQQIEAVSTEAVPIDVSLVIDISGSAADAIGRVKSDVQKIVTMLRPIDRVRLVTFAQDVHEVFPMQAPSAHLSLDKMKADGGTSLNDALLYALAWPAAADRRHLVVVCTDGEDTTSVLDDDTVPAAASRADAVLHAVLFKSSVPAVVRHFQSTPPPPKASRATLVEAASRTGGEAHQLDDAVAAFRQIFDDFRRGYVLRYTLRDVKRQGWHDISVRVTRPGSERYTIHARKGYFVD